MDTTKHSLRPNLQPPPALVEAIHDDPAMFAPAARVMAFQMVHEQYVNRDELTIPQKQALTEILLKAGKIDGKAAEATGQSGPGFNIQINIPGATPVGVTVESTAVTVQDE